MLVGCEFSGRVREAFRSLGHEAVSIDLRSSTLPGPHMLGDVRDHLGDGWDLLIAFPPCTHLTTARNGQVVSASLVSTEDDVMLITDGGVLIRTRASEISELSRATQGVTLISLDDGEKLIGLSRVPETDDVQSEVAGPDGGMAADHSETAGDPTAPDAADPDDDSAGDAPTDGDD